MAFLLGADGLMFFSSVVLCWRQEAEFRQKRLFDRTEPLRPVEWTAKHPREHSNAMPGLS